MGVAATEPHAFLGEVDGLLEINNANSLAGLLV
jgi:hypothetical protein